MTLNSKKITVIFISFLLALALSGCSCKHDWQDGTCQSPRICVLCGKTEGKVRAHKYVNTACHEPQGCVYCGTLEGIEYSHQWRDNCKICIYCGYDGRPADERFPDLLSAGLEERWALEAQLPAEPSAEDWEAIFNAEYERLAVFKEDKLQDEQLQSAVLRYIKSLEASLAALEYFGTELWTDKYHNGAYWEQANVLFLLNQQSPVSVSEQYSEKLSDMLHNGEIIKLVRPCLIRCCSCISILWATARFMRPPLKTPLL